MKDMCEIIEDLVMLSVINEMALEIYSVAKHIQSVYLTRSIFKYIIQNYQSILKSHATETTPIKYDDLCEQIILDLSCRTTSQEKSIFY